MATRAPLKVLTPPKAAVTNRAPATNTVAAADIRDLKPPVEIPTGWAWLGWVLAVLLLGLLALWAWRRWKRQAAAKAAAPSAPPETRARERLQAALKLLSQPEPFCVAVSSAIRVYLEERFDLHAPERTTEEFLVELQGSELLAVEQKRSLGEFLTRCDLVKFARYEPTEVELLELHAAALRLVDETEPRPVFSAAPVGTGLAAEPPRPATPP